MRHKFLKAVGVTLFSLVVLMAVLVITFFVAANSSLPGRLLSEYDHRLINADMELSGFSLHGVSPVKLRLDSLRITYPHGTFPEPAENETGGSGAEVDTLLSADRISLRFKPLRMLFLRRVALTVADVDGLKAYLRRYDDTLSNLSVLGLSSRNDTVNDTDLRLAFGNVTITGGTVIEYSDRAEGLSARLTLDSLGAGGIVRIAPEGIGLRKARMAVDGFSLEAASGGDSCRLDLHSFLVDESRPGFFDVSLKSETVTNTVRYGRMTFPLNLDAGFRVSSDESGYAFDISGLEASAAHIPLSVRGFVKVGGESPRCSLSISSSACPVDTLMTEYSAFVPGLRDMLYLGGGLDLEACLEGSFSRNAYPHIKFSASLPGSAVIYKPLALRGHLSLALDADISSSGIIDAQLHRLACRGEGFDISIGARANGLLSGDPDVSLEADLVAELDKLASSMHFKSPVDAEGNLNLALKWDARLSEIRAMHLDRTAIVGRVTADKLFLSADSLKIKAYSAQADLSSGQSGLALSAGMDSVFIDAGKELSARLRDTRNSVSLTMAPRRSGTMTPKLTMRFRSGRAFVKTGPHRFFGQSLDISASAHKRNVANLLKRNLFLDSLQRLYPDVPRQDLMTVARDSLFRSRPVPAFLSDKSLMKGDLDISLDTSKAGFLNRWSLAGGVSMDRGGMASTVMPLRTRFSGLSVHYDGKNLDVDTLGIVCGTSDLGVRARVDGIGRALVRKSRLNIQADIRSRRVNLNEIISAFKLGEEENLEAHRDIEDVSFVTDTLWDVIPELPPMKLVIVPANVSADVKAILDSVDFTYFRANPLKARLLMKNRTVQFIDSGFLSDYGNLSLDAFYSTISRKDISAGANLSLSSLNAQQIISVLPAVDTLMPALKTFKGHFNCDLSATTKLDTNMNVIPSTLDGLLRIKGSKLHVDEAGALRKLTTTLMFKNKNIGDISDFSASAVAHDGKLEIFPFEFSVDRYRVALWGMQGMDRSLYYHVSLLKSPLIFNFGINIYGTLDRWRWSLTSARYKDGKIPTFSTELDAMQLNISDYVRNIFSRGVADISRFNRKSMEAIADKEGALDLSSGDDFSRLSAEELNRIDAAIMDYHQKQEAEELDKEIEAVLDDSYRQTSQMIEAYVSDFENTAYDNKTRRKMERMRLRNK